MTACYKLAFLTGKRTVVYHKHNCQSGFVNINERQRFNAINVANGVANVDIVNAVDEEVFAASWQPRITQIIEKYLGRGVKVSQCSREQVEALDLIVTELKDIMPS